MPYQRQGSSDLMKSFLALAQVAMTAIAAYVAGEIKDMSKSINNLNVQIASILTQVSNQKEEMNRIDQRLFNVEILKKYKQ